MTMPPLQPQSIDLQFCIVARELCNRFPNLELWFNLEEGTSTMRYGAETISPEVLELKLGLDSAEVLCTQAIFSLKVLARMFDS